MITKMDIVKKVRELAAESPDYVYQSEQGFCKNYHVDSDRNPIEGSGCIVGRALHEVGFSYAEIPETGGVMSVLRELGMPYEGSGEDNWLATVQSYQDCEFRWESAVEAADRQYSLPGLDTAG